MAHQNPEFTVESRYWVEESEVKSALGGETRGAFLCYKDVTSATNQRTMIAAIIPEAGVVNSAPLMLTGADISPRATCCLLANLNSLALDFVARQKVGGVHLNFFIVNQLPIFAPAHYADRCPWNTRQTLERWISDRILKLTCTSNDLREFGESAGMDPPVHRWNPSERTRLQAELDAAYFLMYGLKRGDVEYMLSTFQGLRDDTEPDLGLLDRSSVLDCYDALAARC